jgi:signal transduction histidine kinase
MSAQDQERRRIARELHDGLGQELTVAKMVLDKMVMDKSAGSKSDASSQASAIVDRAIQQVRTMSHLLHPPLLDEVGLLSALSWYTEGLTKRSGIETFLDVQPKKFPRLGTEVETAVFRIVQEALTNVFRHADAHKVWVTLAQNNGFISVSVLDDGKGIEPKVAELRPDSVGVGIGGMKQRAKEFGGELRLSNAAPGTLLEIVIPATTVSREPNAILEECT